MPELPEIETVVRSLRGALTGRAIVGVKVRWPGSIAAPDPAAFVDGLTDQTVTDVRRRGKWIVIALDGDDTLLIHLRMTGQLLLESDGCPDDAYARVILLLEDGQRLRFSDMRKFGRLILTADPAEILDDLGPEPLANEFTAADLRTMLARRRGRVKSLLLNQRFLAGLGNIYTNEALWQAGIHPLRKADDLSSTEVSRLYRAIRSVLRAAIARGGTTLQDGSFRKVDGEPGEFTAQLAVYGREGEPCPRCGEAIRYTKVGQRGTFICPRCQNCQR